jgi:dihydrofolate synthase/folylpolyglutamate synthase
MSGNYQETLDFLYSLQFFGIKLGLDNTRELLARVGNPQRALKVIHLAGTNGKGSTAAALASVFQHAGIRAGLYTSPHLHNFSERIRIDTLPISEVEIVALARELRPHAEELRATFFEVTTVMALLHFQRSGALWAIMETGMGGRLDATNLVDPELCLLTPIALDHTQRLGESLEQIAAEKAGILKPGVAAISALQDDAVCELLRRIAAEQGLPLYEAQRDYAWEFGAKGLSLHGWGQDVEAIQPGLEGQHQAQNLALAVAAIFLLNAQGKLEIGPGAITAGLEQVRWPGRLEWLPQRVLVDGAHNPAGAQTLACYLREQGLERVHLVVGCKEDKQWRELLKALFPHVAALYAVSPPVDKAIEPQLMVALAAESAIPAQAYATPAQAVDAALERRGVDEIVVVAGSLFLVAAVREHLLPQAELIKITAAMEYRCA